MRLPWSALSLLSVACLSEVRVGRGDDTSGGCRQGCERARVFVQVSRFDLLLVVDNSPSMAEEHARLATGFRELLSEAVGADVDAHVGMLATDLDDPELGGRLVRVDGQAWTELDDEDGGITWVETALAVVGSEGGSVERVRAVVNEALGTFGETDNAGFRRDDAHLAVVVLSEEDDASGEAPSLADFADWLDVTWGLPRVTTHAVVGLASACDDPTACLCAEADEHLALVALTGGTSLSICQPDYGPFLSALGQLVVLEGLSTRFVVGDDALPETLAVEVRHPSGFVDALGTGEFAWSAGDQAVVLTEPPPAGSEIEVRYTVR